MHSIVTLTMNPALDVGADAESVRPTDRMRCAGFAPWATPGTVPCSGAEVGRLFGLAEEPMDVGAVCVS